MIFVVPTVLPPLTPTTGFPLEHLNRRCKVDETGAYVVFEDTRALYVGKAINFVQRLSYSTGPSCSHHLLGWIYKQHPSARVLLIIYQWSEIPYPLGASDESNEFNYQNSVRDSLHEFEKVVMHHYRPIYNKNGNGTLMFPTPECRRQ